jgi:hypothetical protein
MGDLEADLIGVFVGSGSKMLWEKETLEIISSAIITK